MRGYDGPVRVHPLLESSVSPAAHAAPLEWLHDRIHPARHPLPRPAFALPVQARWRPARARGLRDLGTLAADASNAILIVTGLSPDAHAAANEANPAPGWWEAMVGPDKPIDTNRWFVVCVNSLGSCKGSTGPASLNRPPASRIVSTSRAVDRRRRARRHRSRACAGHRAAGLRGRQLDGRHDRVGRADAAPGHCAQPRQHFRQRAGAAVLHRDPLAAAKRSALIHAGMAATTTTTRIPSPACAWRASWA